MKSLKEQITESLQVNEDFKDYNGNVYKPIKFNGKTIKPLDDIMAGTVYYELSDDITLYATIDWEGSEEEFEDGGVIDFCINNDGDEDFYKTIKYSNKLTPKELTEFHFKEVNKYLKNPKILKLFK